MFECTLKNAQKGAEKAVLHQCNHHLDYRGETEPPFAEKHNRKHVLTLLRGLADRPLPGAAALARWLAGSRQIFLTGMQKEKERTEITGEMFSLCF